MDRDEINKILNELAKTQDRNIIVDYILYVEDFEYRLNMQRFR